MGIGRFRIQYERYARICVRHFSFKLRSRAREPGQRYQLGRLR
jgi:hypothetical protein